ncbi:MAG: GDP-mannose 4,6-dehydratase [Acidobacteria bacterium]|nr:GDP-mannose 4,6-dehydratase [Acidobacteriota bacterium]
MKTILITGGAGFIGSHLLDRLMQDENNDVVVLDNFNDFYDPKIKDANIAPHAGGSNLTIYQADITDEKSVNEIFSYHDFDCVVHLAARAGVRPSLENPLAYEATNVRGTYVLLEAARQTKVPQFIFGSSSSIYGINAKIPFTENDHVWQTISPYAATKLAGEAICHTYSHLYGMRVVCLRFFTVYGARQRPDLAIHKFARLIDEGKAIPMFGDGSTRRDYTYIDDIIAGIIAAMKYTTSQFEVINLGESQTVELRYLIELIENALGKRALIERQPLQAGDVPITFADISKARRLLDYNPQTKIEDGIRRFVEWFIAVKGCSQ